jgi:hypothetical protein
VARQRQEDERMASYHIWFGNLFQGPYWGSHLPLSNTGQRLAAMITPTPCLAGSFDISFFWLVKMSSSVVTFVIAPTAGRTDGLAACCICCCRQLRGRMMHLSTCCCKSSGSGREKRPGHESEDVTMWPFSPALSRGGGGVPVYLGCHQMTW